MVLPCQYGGFLLWSLLIGSKSEQIPLGSRLIMFKKLD